MSSLAFMQFFLVLSILVGLCSSTYTVFEKISGPPHPWTGKSNSILDLDQQFVLWIHLKNQNRDAFHQRVFDSATPGHAIYGQHLTRQEVEEFLAPEEKAFSLVAQWLDNFEAGDLMGKYIIQDDWFCVNTTLGVVMDLLRADYRLYENNRTGETTVQTLEYSLPAEFKFYVDMIAPTTKFPTSSGRYSTLQPRSSSTSEPSMRNVEALTTYGPAGVAVDVTCNSSITPTCLQQLYGFENFETSGKGQFAVAGFINQFAQHADLAQFTATYFPKVVGSDFEEILVNGGLNTQANSTSTLVAVKEANLDMQYALPLAYPVPIVYISTGGRPPLSTGSGKVNNEPYLEFLNYLLAQESIPQTISISYSDPEFTVPESYARTVCDLFGKLAGRGASVLVASGDHGAGSDCTSMDPERLQYEPAFPASCPFVTSVGATYRINEQAASFSGGGFSNYFPRPAYQDARVSSYLDAHVNASSFQYFNRSGRGYPDVSAQGVYFHVINSGIDIKDTGTSASTPTFASIIALLNSDRIEKNLPPLGLLNPWLYSDASSALNDIVNGASKGCPQVADSGFVAAVGWDPVTGLGTPSFPELRKASKGIGHRNRSFEP